jgi:hypothetical protein
VDLRFDVLVVVNIKIAFFWGVAPCILVEGYQNLEGTCT